MTGHNLTKEEVRRKYIRSATFYLDVLAVIPLEILAPLFANPWRSVSVLRLNRLLKQCKVCMNDVIFAKYMYLWTVKLHSFCSYTAYVLHLKNFQYCFEENVQNALSLLYVSEMLKFMQWALDAPTRPAPAMPA